MMHILSAVYDISVIPVLTDRETPLHNRDLRLIFEAEKFGGYLLFV